jgi:endo-1,4-beta-xylanase
MLTENGLNRRSLLTGTAVLCANTLTSPLQAAVSPSTTDTSSLKRAAEESGVVLGVFTISHELIYDQTSSAIIDKTFSMIADGNDLKFANRLRPAPDRFDFASAEAVVGWAEAHHKAVRGHCLIWWNALPSWFQSYVNAQNARQVLTNHITTVVKHFAGRIYCWDVVNEMIRIPDRRPDGLRNWPWLNFLGPGYIDLALHTAAEADPKAQLILNENGIEHATPFHQARRDAYLGLATRLKSSGVPITGLGVQGHIQANVPLDKPGMTEFCQRVRDLGLDLMITEMDVDDSPYPPGEAAGPIASRYGEFIEMVGPYAKSITLEATHDQPNYTRADGQMHRVNLWDDTGEPTPAYVAAVDAFKKVAAQRKTRKKNSRPA